LSEHRYYPGKEAFQAELWNYPVDQEFAVQCPDEHGRFARWLHWSTTIDTYDNTRPSTQPFDFCRIVRISRYVVQEECIEIHSVYFYKEMPK